MIKVTDYKPHISEEKKQVVDELKKLMDQYPVVGAVDVEKLPAKQLMVMRKKLSKTAKIIMTKKRLIGISLDKSKKDNIVELKQYLKGMPALIFTNENPFSLFKVLKKNKSPAPIKAGETAPKDIEVKAGPTEFAPGPIIGELGSIGIKTGVEAGKIAIKEDAIVAKEGDVVSAKLAGLLQRLGIQPMEIGLNITAVYENGIILKKDVLDVDEEQYISDIKQAASDAFRLAIAEAIPNKDTITQLISKAHSDSYALADAQDIITSENVDKVLAKADRQAAALSEKVKES